MLKTVYISLFCMMIGSASFAAENVIENNGKEKPRGFSFENSFNKLESFSLKSNRQFRGDNVIANNANSNTYINFNTEIIYKKGADTYVIPYKKKVILNNRVTFNPNSNTRNY